MITTYLFDWGNTLMVDFPNEKGRMCDWETVEAIAGAKEALVALSKVANIFVATSAEDSSVSDIQSAFDRVNLSQYISGYFCQANLGVAKGSAQFLNLIINEINQPIENIVMVGDSFEKDIKPALDTGIGAIWLTSNPKDFAHSKVRIINKLSDLISPN